MMRCAVPTSQSVGPPMALREKKKDFEKKRKKKTVRSEEKKEKTTNLSSVCCCAGCLPHGLGFNQWPVLGTTLCTVDKSR